jgi:cytochrome c
MQKQNYCWPTKLSRESCSRRYAHFDSTATTNSSSQELVLFRASKKLARFNQEIAWFALRCYATNNQQRRMSVSKYISRHVGAGLAAVAVGLVALTQPGLAGDVANGEKVFKKCMACHSVAEPKNKVGPHLVGIVGRSVGTAEGFTYSDGLKEFATKQAAWDEATLDKYLENPKAMVPATKMAFAGLKKPEDRADIIAFLLTKK